MGFGGGAVMSMGVLDSVGRRGNFIYDNATRGGGIGRPPRGLGGIALHLEVV